MIIAVAAMLACNKSGLTHKPSNDLTELGFYVVSSGKATHLSFRESGKTTQPADIPVLRSGDYMLLFGEMPSGPFNTGISVFPYQPTAGVASTGQEISIDSFFAVEPQEAVRSQPVIKLSPKASVPTGMYFLHKYVGMNGVEYLFFRLER
jgi:hypothetical protein